MKSSGLHVRAELDRSRAEDRRPVSALLRRPAYRMVQALESLTRDTHPLTGEVRRPTSGYELSRDLRFRLDVRAPFVMDPGYFEELYARNPDPWGFQSRWYERRKYALTLAALPRERYASVFEPGCSIGVLTAQLAGRADRLLACDVVPAALEQARERLATEPGGARVVLREWDANHEWPDDSFDLVVVSEMLYYLEAGDARRFMTALVEHLEPEGQVVAVHWRHDVGDYPLTGDEANAVVRATAGLTSLAHYEDGDVVLDVMTHGSDASVATLEGLS